MVIIFWETETENIKNTQGKCSKMKYQEKLVLSLLKIEWISPKFTHVLSFCINMNKKEIYDDMGNPIIMSNHKIYY